MRPNDLYFADIRRAIRDFYRPGDQLRLVRTYRENRKCEMCGGVVDIINCYDLQNVRSGKVIVCGERCIARYAEVVAHMGQLSSVIFPYCYREKAQKINKHRPKTIEIEQEIVIESDEETWALNELLGQRAGADDPEDEEAIAEGLDPEDMDWESHDYE